MSERRCCTTPLGVLLFAAIVCGCTRDDAGGGAGPGLPQRHDVEASWFQSFPDAGTRYAFGALVRGFFLKSGIDTDLTEDGVLVLPKTHEEHRLDELAAKCAALPRSGWEDAIAAHFGELSSIARAAERRTTPAWDDAKPRLRLRIHTDEFLAAAGVDASDVVCRRDLPGLTTCVVLDDEATALVVPRTDLEAWGRPIEAVFEIALANTRAALDGVLELGSHDVPGLGALRVVTGDSFFTAAAVLWLDAWPELIGTHGTLVAVPWRRAIFAWPIDDAKQLETLVPALYRYAEKIVETHQDVVGPTVYWRKPGGGFARFRISENDAGQLEIVPPRDLVELLR
ncbi:MAG: hypothetical protein IPM29_21645 [Planctomycetes bacterium]|nr:hypothetical protein [Planctomycetota bacterium]